MVRVVYRREHVSVHIVDRFALQKVLGESLKNFMALADSIFPMLKSSGGFAWRFCLRAQRATELRVMVSGETKNHFGEVLFGGRATAGAASHLARVDGIGWFQREVTLPNKNGAGHESIDQSQQSDRSRAEVEGSHVHGQREIFATERVAQAVVAELAVNDI